MNLLYIDLFCGAGGVTTGISQVPGVHVVACVNHDADAIASHAANHPRTLHYTEDIRTLDTAPMVSRLETMRARYPWAKTVLWASCECTNFSRAKGGKPRDPDSRSLAEHLYRYIEALEPDYIQIENVTEFLEWGPLVEQDGQLMPDPDRKGDSFREWFSHIEGMGYKGGWRIFNSADFGAYTSRTRLFIQFARTGFALAWPKPTHRRENWKACREVLDLTDFGKSIFTRKKPLCDNTLRRLTEGIRKFANSQFVFRYMTGPGHVHSPEKPCVTLCTQKNLYLAAGKFMTRYFSGKGHNISLDGACGTLTTIPHQYPVTVTFMDNYFGNGYPTSIDEPCGTLCTRQQRFPRHGSLPGKLLFRRRPACQHGISVPDADDQPQAPRGPLPVPGPAIQPERPGIPGLSVSNHHDQPPSRSCHGILHPRHDAPQGQRACPFRGRTHEDPADEGLFLPGHLPVFLHGLPGLQPARTRRHGSHA